MLSVLDVQVNNLDIDMSTDFRSQCYRIHDLTICLPVLVFDNFVFVTWCT